MATSAFRPFWTGCIAVLLTVVAAAPGSAKAPAGAGGARDMIQHLYSQATQALGPSIPTSQRIGMFRQLLNKDFDVADAARFALGPYARRLTKLQEQDFLNLYRDNLAEAYADRLGQYTNAPFRITGARPIGGATVVNSEVLRRDGPPVRIDWQIADRDGRLEITDVLVDGVSQKLAQRQEFMDIIRRNGGQPGAVIAALRQRLQTGPH
jgi:phospholipid transport system substrate-binding protein